MAYRSAQDRDTREQGSSDSSRRQWLDQHEVYKVTYDETHDPQPRGLSAQDMRDLHNKFASKKEFQESFQRTFAKFHCARRRPIIRAFYLLKVPTESIDTLC